jgi:hypothetical protein
MLNRYLYSLQNKNWFIENWYSLTRALVKRLVVRDELPREGERRPRTETKELRLYKIKKGALTELLRHKLKDIRMNAI